MITIEDAILALVPNAEFVVYENKIIQWDSEGTQPTEDEIATKKTELQTEFESNEYQRDRALAYRRKKLGGNDEPFNDQF